MLTEQQMIGSADSHLGAAAGLVTEIGQHLEAAQLAIATLSDTYSTDTPTRLWAYVSVSIGTRDGIRAIAHERRCRLSDVVIAAVAALESTTTGTPDLTDGLPIVGPSNAEVTLKEQFRVTPAQHHWLERQVAEVNLSMSQLVGRALDSYVIEHAGSSAEGNSSS